MLWWCTQRARLLSLSKPTSLASTHFVYSLLRNPTAACEAANNAHTLHAACGLLLAGPGSTHLYSSTSLAQLRHFSSNTTTHPAPHLRTKTWLQLLEEYNASLRGTDNTPHPHTIAKTIWESTAASTSEETQRGVHGSAGQPAAGIAPQGGASVTSSRVINNHALGESKPSINTVPDPGVTLRMLQQQCQPFHWQGPAVLLLADITHACLSTCTPPQLCSFLRYWSWFLQHGKISRHETLLVVQQLVADLLTTTLHFYESGNSNVLDAWHLHTILHAIQLTKHPAPQTLLTSLHNAFSAAVPHTPAPHIAELFESLQYSTTLPSYIDIPALCLAFSSDMRQCSPWDVTYFLAVLVKWYTNGTILCWPLEAPLQGPPLQGPSQGPSEGPVNQFEAVGMRITDLLHAFSANRLSQLMYAFAKLGRMPHSVDINFLGHCVTALATKCTPRHLATLLASWNSLHLSPHALGLRHIGTVVSQQLRHCAPHDLTIIVGTFAAWLSKPATLDSEDLAHAISYKLPKFKAADLAGIICPLHTIHVPTQLLHDQRLGMAVCKHLSCFTPTQLLHVLQGFALHGYLPRPLRKQQLALGQAMMSALPFWDVYHCERLLFSLSSLNILPRSLDLQLLAVELRRKGTPPAELASSMRGFWGDLFETFGEREGFEGVTRVLDWWVLVS